VVQDVGTYFTSCTLHNRAGLIDGMAGMGYRLAHDWACPDLRLDVPGWPERSVLAYSGFAWERDGADVTGQ
jgi:hypothetical protein